VPGLPPSVNLPDTPRVGVDGRELGAAASEVFDAADVRGLRILAAGDAFASPKSLDKAAAKCLFSVLFLEVLLEVDTLGLRVREVTDDSEPTSDRRLPRLVGATASIASMAALTSS